MFHLIMITVMVYCVNKSHSDPCTKIIMEPEPTSSVCFTNLSDWISATELRGKENITFSAAVDEGQFILHLKDNMFFDKFRRDYYENNTIFLQQGRSITKSDCIRNCSLNATWIRRQEFYRIITPPLSRGNIKQCEGWLESKVVDIETGCYQFTFNAFSVCYWLDTNWTITPTEYPLIITTYNDKNGTMTLTWNQTQRKPAFLKLNGLSNEITVLCCSYQYHDDCHGNRVKVKCNQENISTIICSFGPVPKDKYTLFIAEAHDLRCTERGDCNFFQGPMKEINLLDSQSTPHMQNLNLFVFTMLTVAAVLSIIAIIWYYWKRYHPAGPSSAGLEQGTDLITLRTNSLLVLYPDDCPKLHDAMEIFCNLLGCDGQCKVYNILDHAEWRQVLNDGPHKWLTDKLTEVDKVILVETHASHILQFTEARYYGKHDNAINMSLAQFYHDCDKTLSITGSREKLIRVRLNGFSPENKVSPLIKLYKPHSTPPSLGNDIPYTLPQAVPLLIQHLRLNVGQGELEEAISRLSESLERLINYNRNHRNYIQHILVQVNSNSKEKSYV